MKLLQVTAILPYQKEISDVFVNVILTIVNDGCNADEAIVSVLLAHCATFPYLNI